MLNRLEQRYDNMQDLQLIHGNAHAIIARIKSELFNDEHSMRTDNGPSYVLPATSELKDVVSILGRQETSRGLELHIHVEIPSVAMKNGKFEDILYGQHLSGDFSLIDKSKNSSKKPKKKEAGGRNYAILSLVLATASLVAYAIERDTKPKNTAQEKVPLNVNSIPQMQSLNYVPSMRNPAEAYQQSERERMQKNWEEYQRETEARRIKLQRTFEINVNTESIFK